jgi:transcriptional regulator with XRE-family HTH domain
MRSTLLSVSLPNLLHTKFGYRRSMAINRDTVKGDRSDEPKDSPLRAFLERLDDIMRRRRINRNRLSKEVGVSSGTVSEWWTQGRVPSGDVILRLPGILGVSAAELFGEEPPSGERGPSSLEPVGDRERLELLAMLGSLAGSVGEIQEVLARGPAAAQGSPPAPYTATDLEEIEWATGGGGGAVDRDRSAEPGAGERGLRRGAS